MCELSLLANKPSIKRLRFWKTWPAKGISAPKNVFDSVFLIKYFQNAGQWKGQPGLLTKI